jgi:uncharacterized phage protein gp47/JayE
MSGATSNGFIRETLPRLIERAQTDIEVNLPNANARLPQSNLDALACMAAGMTDEQLEGIDHYAQQIHVTTARGVWLRRHGSEWGVLPREATAADGVLLVPVAANTTILAGALFQTRERLRVRTTEDRGTIPAGTLAIPAVAVETGAAGNLPTGTLLDTVNPIPGVATGASVEAPGFAGGNPAEQTEVYRRRILDRIQRPPQGGAEHDYVAWMRDYPGCTRAWVQPRPRRDPPPAPPPPYGIGSVVCRFVMDDTYPDGIPPAAEVARMAQWLEVRRPVTAEVFVFAPTPLPIDVVVRDLQPNTGAVQDAVEDELRDMLFREGEPGAVLHRSWFWEAVSVAAGERSHTIDVPAAEIVALQPGELGVLGNLDFVFSAPRLTRL